MVLYAESMPPRVDNKVVLKQLCGEDSLDDQARRIASTDVLVKVLPTIRLVE
ncbi:hypothetical protein F441_22308 [Phytophthora nicotianae CJ01A1]|uniref:Uncharacterized protein n=1 Tax=Phytophthora nicotianae CJ01A1 TaxID=1317063 RepID=W2VPK4_PHYNI|nr:hypothetical protein F441_22308 [Phytophthora nicotianae CJ01A1]